MEKNKFKTEQERFWAGEFGDKYITRNKNERILSANINIFSKILGNTSGIKSVIEYGANIGLNLIAIRKLLPGIELSAVEINASAVRELKKIRGIKVYHSSINDFKIDFKRDFVLIKGVLIHINPDYLSNVYSLLYSSSSKYVCIAEYYNPKPVSVPYRGHEGKLFKRDFAGELMEKYRNLRLVDYGFIYHNDNNFPLDDITWFLLEKWKEK